MNIHEDFISKFAIMIPIYNEEKNIINLIEELTQLEIPYIIIDNGSKDKTVTTLWLKDIPAVCIYPKRNKSLIIQLGARSLIKEGYKWILLINKIKNPITEDINKLDNVLLWSEEEAKIFITKSGNKLIHKDIFEQIKTYKWFNLELNWKIKWLKWKVKKVD